MKLSSHYLLHLLLPLATSTILWDGRFNDLTSSTDLNLWSWSNEVGPYQYYIHGPSNVTSYVNLSPSYKNPADGGSVQGARITLDNTSYWEGQTMRRTELIPQTAAAIGSGRVWYRWISGEAGTSDPLLRWDVSGTTYWNVTWDAGTWHNVAYEIDFTANTVAFWHSTGSDPLVLTVSAISVTTYSNGADWHLGVLELPVTGVADTTEDYYFSGVYVENGTITTSISGPGGVVVSSSSSATATTTSTKASSSASASTSIKSSTTSSAASSSTLSTLVTSTTSSVASTSTCATLVPEYGQCGGQSGVFTGCTTCASPYVCHFYNIYYSQCLTS